MTNHGDTTATTMTLVVNANSPLKKNVDGASSLLAGLCFVIGFALYLSTLSDLQPDSDLSKVETVQFIKDHEAVYYLSNMILYIIFGLAQLVLTFAMQRRIFNTKSSVNVDMVFLSTALGVIWSALVIAAGMLVNVGAQKAIDLLKDDAEAAGALWAAVDTIGDGLGGGNEIVGGLWVMMVSLSSDAKSFKERNILSKTVSVLGMIAGMASIVSMVPTIDSAGAVFGIAMVFWYFIVAIMFFSGEPSSPSSKDSAHASASNDSPIPV